LSDKLSRHWELYPRPSQKACAANAVGHVSSNQLVFMRAYSLGVAAGGGDGCSPVHNAVLALLLCRRNGAWA
jgi:hypothetical protein